MSEHEQSQLRTLTREECLALLRHGVIGRIGYVVDGLAVIVPVNFVVVGDDIVFCTAKGSKLAWLSSRSHLAFEVDESRTSQREGWSVLVHGSAHEVTDPHEIDELRHGQLHSWVHPAAEHWVRIAVEKISGRALQSG
jgi:uncharacterized protein